MKHLTAAALAYADTAWPVFPCRPGSKTPCTIHGCKDATVDPATITRWWTRWVPGANVAIATGAVSGLVVVDLDCKDDVDGFATWCQLMSTLGAPWAPTRTVITPTGGFHWYYRHPGDGVLVRNSASELGSGIDVRGDGGFVLVPPSRNGVGGYELDQNLPVAPLPTQLLELVARSEPEPEPELAPIVKLRRRLARPTPTGGVGYTRAALEGEVQNVIDAAAGTRNPTLNRAAYKLGGLDGLDNDEIEHALLATADVTGLVDDDGEAACLATIRSGLRAGRTKPR
jgi:Bifunctional DNA primase/polymerase, N-terminal